MRQFLLLISFGIFAFILPSCKKSSNDDLAWIKQDLLAYYPFNGNAKDSSGNGYDGVVNGAVLTTDRNGKTNGAYTFPNNSYIAVNLNQTHFSGDFTISLWAQLDNTTVTDPFLMSSTFMGLYYKGNTVRYSLMHSGSVTNQWLYSGYQANIQVSNWNQITIMARKDTTRFYINGAHLGSAAFPVPRKEFPMSNYFVFGRDYNGYNPQYYNFLGKLDDIRFYKRALTDDEVKFLYRN